MPCMHGEYAPGCMASKFLEIKFESWTKQKHDSNCAKLRTKKSQFVSKKKFVFKNWYRQQRYQLLKTKWKSPEGFSWPFTERMDKGKLRKKYLGSQHFESHFDTFSYSESKQGIFCKTCVLFNTLESVRGSKINRLVKELLKKYVHLTGKDGYLTQHLKNIFHEYSAQAATDFLKTIESGSDISSLLNQEAAGQRMNNRSCLKRILQAIEFYGRLGLALRGHRDSGELLIEERFLGNLN